MQPTDTAEPMVFHAVQSSQMKASIAQHMLPSLLKYLFVILVAFQFRS
jgi:hypothetical protein